MTKKRLFDLTVTMLGAIVWVPVVLTAALAVLLLSGRPVLYRSHRRLSNADVSRIVKFRTMVKNADKVANRETVPVENRVRFLNIPPDSPLYTSVGRTLERFGLTELPQLVHVLTGKMSLVGNRPLPENVMDCLREEYAHADLRFESPAGLTGPAQLVGRDALTDDERLHLEGAYCVAARNGYTMRLDLAIIWATITGVLGLRPTMAYHDVLEYIDRHSGGRSASVHVLPQPAEVVTVPAAQAS